MHPPLTPGTDRPLVSFEGLQKHHDSVDLHTNKTDTIDSTNVDARDNVVEELTSFAKPTTEFV